MSKFEYKEYDDKPKEERRKLAAAKGHLDRKRFYMSREPIWRERIKKLRELAVEFEKEHPEFISLNLFGSVTKGYAIPESDIDAYVFLDNDKFSECPRQDDDLREKIRLALSFSDEMAVKDVRLKFVTKKDLRQLCLSDEFFYGEEKLAPLFFLSAGRKINEYRKVVLDSMASLGTRGESRWRSVVDLVNAMENKVFGLEFTKKRERLYPKTIAEAKKYFFHQKDDTLHP